MAGDKSTIARPYAHAAFEAASERRALASWGQALTTAAQVVRDPRVARLVSHPRVSPGQLAQLIIDVVGTQLDEPGRNFLRTLAENRRLEVLPEIAALFERLKDEAEGTIDVTVTSAVELPAEQRSRLATALAKRLGRRVELHCEIDPQLIGGAVLRAGDMVIDGSLRSRLERLELQVTA